MYCTDYCACYEEIEGGHCSMGGQCADACVEELTSEDTKEDWLRRLECAQTADCKQVLEEC
jgi:hypothetical protein